MSIHDIHCQRSGTTCHRASHREAMLPLAGTASGAAAVLLPLGVPPPCEGATCLAACMRAVEGTETQCAPGAKPPRRARSPPPLPPSMTRTRRWRLAGDRVAMGAALPLAGWQLQQWHAVEEEDSVYVAFYRELYVKNATYTEPESGARRAAQGEQRPRPINSRWRGEKRDEEARDQGQKQPRP